MYDKVLAAVLVIIALHFQLSLAQIPEDGDTFVENEITIHVVTVGQVAHSFSPDAVTANPGDKIMFKFYAGNHSVIESGYGWPCVAKEGFSQEQGFYSYPQENATAEEPTVWNLTITHTGPTFYFCGAPGSCVNYAMLGVINPDSTVNLTGQKELAKAGRYVLYPNQTLPADASQSLSALASQILSDDTSSSTVPSATAEPSQTAEPTQGAQATTTAASHHSGGLSGGAIGGIVAGAVVGVIIIGALLFYFGRSKGQIKALKDIVRRSQAPEEHAPPEMTVGGVTYVRAGGSRTMSPKPSFLPPYVTPDPRSKSPESVSVYGPPVDLSAPQNQTRFSGVSPSTEHGFYAPTPRYATPRHEMPVAATPALPEEPIDVERFSGIRHQQERQ